jgi:uncharacterized protein DUF4235
MAKILYRPLGIGFSVLGGILASVVFKQIWKLVASEDEAPDALQGEYGWGQILPAAAVQGAIFALVKAAVDRGGAEGFQKLTGAWPGD